MLGLLYPAMRPVTPRSSCGRCGEYLPHYCAAEVTWGRRRGYPRLAGRAAPRVLRIRDRMLEDNSAVVPQT